MTLGEGERDDRAASWSAAIASRLTTAAADVFAGARRTVLIALGTTVVVAETTARALAATRAWRPPTSALGSLERKR
nr:hypothetical protein Hi04_10k_c1000_00017 [uncultured bacterium]